jgi:hypothetical protein
MIDSRPLVVLLLSATASASPWRIDPGPAMLGGGSSQRIGTLDDGRVFVDVGSLPMVLDAKASAWSWLGDKQVMGIGPSARIPGGILVARGAIKRGDGGHALAWDHTTNAWRTSGGLLVEREYEAEELTATLADGSVLVVGGTQDKNPRVLAEAERWSAGADAFQPAGQLRTPRWDFTLTALPDGRALAAGGADDYGRGHWTAQCDVYDPKTNAWTSTGDLHVARRGHTATLLPDGHVLIAGGLGRDEHPIAELEIWDPKTGKWTIAAKLSEPRAYHGAVMLPNNRVLFVGGTRGDDLYIRFENGTAALAAETYDVATNRWDPVFYPPHPYEKPMLATLPDGRLVVAGGYDFTTTLTRVELWTHTTGPDAPWELIRAAASPPPALALPSGMGEGSTMTLLSGGGALAVGGNAWQALSAQRWDPTTKTWTDVAIHAARIHHIAAILPDGRVLIAGGEGLGPKQTRPTMAVPALPRVKTAELFDPTTGRFERTGAPVMAFASAAATVLADGRVLVTGGGGAMAELYAAKTGRFTRAPAMHASRSGHTATTLHDGRVVAIGGDAKGTFEVYDPVNNTWSIPRLLPEPWQGHRAELMADGRVRVTVRGRSIALRID